ncbi:MAG: hypothetical protein WAN56_08565 [Halobacteriota archaeon]
MSTSTAPPRVQHEAQSYEDHEQAGVRGMTHESIWPAIHHRLALLNADPDRSS